MTDFILKDISKRNKIQYARQKQQTCLKNFYFEYDELAFKLKSTTLVLLYKRNDKQKYQSYQQLNIKIDQRESGINKTDINFHKWDEFIQ